MLISCDISGQLMVSTPHSWGFHVYFSTLHGVPSLKYRHTQPQQPIHQIMSRSYVILAGVQNIPQRKPQMLIKYVFIGLEGGNSVCSTDDNGACKGPPLLVKCFKEHNDIQVCSTLSPTSRWFQTNEDFSNITHTFKCHNLGEISYITKTL
jgi:hypothetical protein